jgi:single-strand DNA-binding protein
MNTIKNKVTLIGNVSKAPEVKQIAENKKVARIYLASNEVYKNAKSIYHPQ